MKLLLVGEIYSENLGDPLLCSIVENIIKDNYPSVEIYKLDISGREEFDKFHKITKFSFLNRAALKIFKKLPKIANKHPLYRLFDKDRERLLRMIDMLNYITKNNSFDIVVFAGGSIFMNYFSAAIYFVVRKFRFKKTKIIFHACGVSDLSEDSIFILSKVFNQRNVVSISLRDSYERFTKIFSTHAIVSETYDTALCCKEYYNASSKCIAEYGFGIIDIPDLYGIQRNIMKQIITSGISCKIFSNGARYDYNFAVKMLDEIGIHGAEQKKYLIERSLSPEDLVNVVTSFHHIICFRLHSQIISVSYGIPCFGFVWNSKVKDFFDKLGFAGNCSSSALNFDEIIRSGALNIDGDKLYQISKIYGDKSRRNLLQIINMCITRR